MKTKLLLHGTRISMLIMIILAGSLSRTFAQQGIIYSDGLNGSGSTLSVAGGAFYSGSTRGSGTGDRVASSLLVSEGTGSYGVQNGVATLTSSVMNTSQFSNVQLSLDLAAFAIGSSGEGMDANDVVTIGINTDGSNTFTTILTVTGNNNAYWAFSSTAASVNYPSPATFTPSAATGNKTTDGYSSLLISKLPSTATLRVKITLTNTNNNERWVVDNFQVTGITTRTWNGTSTSKWGTAASWNPSGVPGDGDSVVFNSTASPVLDVTPNAIRALTIANSSTVALASASFSSRAIALSNPGKTALSVGAGSSLILDGANSSSTSLSFTGTNNGSIIAGNLSLNITGNNGNYNATNSLTTVTGTLTNNGGTLTSSTSNLIFNSGGTYVHAFDNGTIPTAKWNTGSTCKITGVTSNTVGGINPVGGFANFTWSCPGQAVDISFAGGLGAISGDFTVTNTNTHSIRLLNAGTTLKQLIGGNFVQTGGTFYVLGSGGNTTSSAMTVNGNFSLTGGTFVLNGATTGTGVTDSAYLILNGDFTATGGTFKELVSSTSYKSLVNFVKAGTQTFTSGATMTGSIDFTVANGSTLQMGSSATPAIISGGIVGMFTLSPGATLGVTSPAGITSTGATGNIQSTGTRTFTASTSSYIYNGGAAQQTGSGLPSTVSNLIINNAAGVTPTQALAIGGKLTLIAGKFDASTKSLTMNSGSIITGGSSSSYIVTGNGSAGTGALIRIAAAGSYNNFPIGTTAYYLPVSVTPVSASTFSGTVFQGATLDGTPGGTQFSNKSNIVDAVWNVTRTAGTGNANLTIQWNDALEGATFANLDKANIGISHYTAGAWQNAVQTSADAAADTVSSTFSSFSPFGVSAISTPLPVILVDFNAVMNKSRTVDLAWSTQQEVNSSHFDVQRSADGSSWTTIGTVQAKGNTSYLSNYSFNDPSPVGTVDYYRLKMVDRDGKFGYTDIKIVRLSIIGNISIFPNPTKDFINVTLSGSSSEQTVKLINLNGQVLQEKKVNSLTGSTISLAVHNYAQGDYFIQVVGADGSQQVSKIVVTR